MRDQAAHQRQRDRDTQLRLQADRPSYLRAVAVHHVRVAELARDMVRMAKSETWECDYPEYMVSQIERSHREAFGSSILESTDEAPAQGLPLGTRADSDESP